ncbi:MAG: hypothetical protein BA864_01465 [Desulfuromonadales bacterium C00003093]|nr:MAG: hypothetical protein BA864_01465 [Desulfuromonadales bacterium C00003093]
MVPGSIYTKGEMSTGEQLSIDYLTAIGEKRYTDYSLWTKFAFNTGINTGALKILSNNLAIVQPSSGRRMSIVSTSVNDDVAGTGLRKVLLQYWDSSWVLQSEVLEMDGTTEVNTDATDIFRIEALYRIDCGSGLCADGTITMGDVPAGVPIYAQIDPDRAQFTRCLHYVAPGNIGIVPSIVASARTSGGVTFIIIVDQDFSPIGGLSRVPVGVGELEHSSGGTSYVRMDPPLAIDNREGITGMAVGVVCAAVSAAGQDGSAAFTVYEYAPRY